MITKRQDLKDWATREGQVQAKLEPRERRRGRVILYTGHGKGKTTAALGLAWRARGRGLQPIVFQFVKSAKSVYGEHLEAEKLGVEIIPLGDGFTWDSKNLEIDRGLAQKAWGRAREAVMDDLHDLVVLDELTYLVNWKWVSAVEVLQTLQSRPKWKHVVITGRDADPALIEIADTVTEMKEIKHAFNQGIVSQVGIEL